MNRWEAVKYAYGIKRGGIYDIDVGNTAIMWNLRQKVCMIKIGEVAH